MMKAMFDTNIIIDYLADRAPFADHAEKMFDLCEQDALCGVLTASAVTDVYYVMRKIAGREKTLENIKLLLSVFEVAEVGKNDLLRAAESPMTDYEDALVAVCAKRVKAEYIVTRNIEDFKKSPVCPITPEAFLAQY